MLLLEWTFMPTLKPIFEYPVRVPPQIVLEGCCSLPALSKNEYSFLPLIQKMAPFLPFSKKREKGCLLAIILYTLNMSCTFKLKSPLEIENVPLRISKVPFS